MKYLLIPIILIILTGGLILFNQSSKKQTPAQTTSAKPTATSNNQNQSQPQVSYSLSPASGNYKVSEKFDVKIMLDGGSYNVGAADFTVNFDKNILTMDSFSPSSIFNTLILNSPPDNQKGKLRFVGGNNSLNKIAGNKIEIGTIHFKAKSAGSAEVSLTSNDLAVRTNPPSDVPANGAKATYTVK